MASIRPFIPGNSPCNGDCPLEWAAPALGVEPSVPTMMTLPEGTICSQMTYAKNGEPYVSQQGYYLVFDETGVGYATAKGVMFQFDACQNWSLCHVQPASLGPAPALRTEAREETLQTHRWGVLHTSDQSPAERIFLGSVGGSYWGYSSVSVVVSDSNASSPPPPAIPLPPSGLMLASVLAIALLWRIK